MAVRTPFNRRRSGSKPAGNTQGETRASVEQDQSLPRLPHEHDESSDSQASPPRPEMQQAAKDLKRGLVDTGRSPVTDATYDRLKSAGT